MSLLGLAILLGLFALCAAFVSLIERM